ncbi:MAG: hypothetical protein AB4058_11935 [Microcystaceae cyanobacterium]
MTKVTINLPEYLVESAQHLEKATAREMSDVFVDILAIILPTLDQPSYTKDEADISQLLDSEVIELAKSKMDAVQNQRLGELQAKGKQVGLTEAEGYELSILISIYQMGQFKKSIALAEAEKRGLKIY